MSDQTYTEKENSKAVLLSALLAYIGAAEADDMDDDEQQAEVEDLFTDAGKKWDVLPR